MDCVAKRWSSGIGQTDSCRALRGGDGSRHRRRRYCVLQKQILGTVGSECWNCVGVRSFLLQIPEESLNSNWYAGGTTRGRGARGEPVAARRYICAVNLLASKGRASP